MTSHELNGNFAECVNQHLERVQYRRMIAGSLF